jgi:hypothetical protein
MKQRGPGADLGIACVGVDAAQQPVDRGQSHLMLAGVASQSGMVALDVQLWAAGQAEKGTGRLRQQRRRAKAAGAAASRRVRGRGHWGAWQSQAFVASMRTCKRAWVRLHSPTQPTQSEAVLALHIRSAPGLPSTHKAGFDWHNPPPGAPENVGIETIKLQGRVSPPGIGYHEPPLQGQSEGLASRSPSTSQHRP